MWGNPVARQEVFACHLKIIAGKPEFMLWAITSVYVGQEMTPRICKSHTAYLLALGATYAKHRGIKLATVSRACLGDSPALERIRDHGGSVTLRKFDDAMQWFDEHWPDKLAWPRLDQSAAKISRMSPPKFGRSRASNSATTR